MVINYNVKGTWKRGLGGGQGRCPGEAAMAGREFVSCRSAEEGVLGRGNSLVKAREWSMGLAGPQDPVTDGEETGQRDWWHPRCQFGTGRLPWGQWGATRGWQASVSASEKGRVGAERNSTAGRDRWKLQREPRPERPHLGRAEALGSRWIRDS